jgi:shikimate kinase
MKEEFNTKPPRIFVIGFIGSRRMERGEELARELGYQLLDLDRMIEERDGRSLKKLIMMMGEHEYRNKEYEILKELESQQGFVLVCGDGIVHDEMNLAILKREATIFVEEPLESLWERVREKADGLYAFLHDSDRERARKKFMEFYQLRLPLYREASSSVENQKL